MSKINMLLAVVLMCSCLVLVKSAYESRRVFAALDQARAEQKLLDAEFKRLDAEAQAQATHLRVERTARDRLQMRTATPGVTAYVAAAAAAVPPAAEGRVEGGGNDATVSAAGPVLALTPAPTAALSRRDRGPNPTIADPGVHR